MFFEVLIASMHGDLYKGDDHGEDHPDVQHLHVGGDWQGLGESKKAATKLTNELRIGKRKTHKVARTRKMVRLTSTTIST